MLAHAVMTDSRMWDAQVPALLDLGLRVLRYDCRGHGESTAPASPYSIRALAADAVGLLDRLGIQQCHFVGLSLGGIVGFDLATNHSKRLRSLVIADARADASPEFAAPWDDRIKTARARGMQALVEPTMDRWFGTAFRSVPASEDIRRMIRSTQVTGFVGAAKALQDFDYRSGLSALAVPTTLLVGERDGVLPDVMRHLADTIHCALEVVPSAGHLPNIEEAAVFNAALGRHFARLDRMKRFDVLK